jgi:predicted TIM-barrel fold metal-dependent hydrolase
MASRIRGPIEMENRMTALSAIPIIDVDSHVAEPEDLWTSRISQKKWGDAIPHIEWDEAAGELRWRIGNTLLAAVGEYCTAGWHEHFPSHPANLDEADHACWSPEPRLKRLDEWGITGQVLYPNIIGFDTHAFLHQLGPELALECVRAYNDFLADFTASDPKRFIPIMMLPLWDVDACLVEMKRAADLGHKGVLMAALLDRIGLGDITDERWEPMLAAAQDMDLSLNFHIGFSVRESSSSSKGWQMRTKAALAERLNRKSFVHKTGLMFSSVVEAAGLVIMGGVAAKYPRLKFVSVESGFGYWPYVLEQWDWLWQSSGAALEFPDTLLPSELWRRQFYATFWFEKESLSLLENYQDNIMFETDFPHETSLIAAHRNPRELITANMSDMGVPVDVAEKVLYKNAAKLYRL